MTSKICKKCYAEMYVVYDKVRFVDPRVLYFYFPDPNSAPIEYAVFDLSGELLVFGLRERLYACPSCRYYTFSYEQEVENDEDMM